MTQPQSAQSCCLRPSPTLLLPPGMSGDWGMPGAPPYPPQCSGGHGEGGVAGTANSRLGDETARSLKDARGSHIQAKLAAARQPDAVFKAPLGIQAASVGTGGGRCQAAAGAEGTRAAPGPAGKRRRGCWHPRSCRELSDGARGWLAWSRATARAAFSSVPIPRRVEILPPCETRCWKLHL